MSQASIPVRSVVTPYNELYEVLADAGCLVVQGLASKEAMNAVRAELASDMAMVSAEEDDPTLDDLRAKARAAQENTANDEAIARSLEED